MASMVRTEIRVPAGIVTKAGFISTCATVPGSSGSELCGCGEGALAALSESNLSETTSAILYFCAVEPTWKLISVSVPPRNLPLIRLPFFNSNVSAHAIDAAKARAVRNPHFSLRSMITFDAPAYFLDTYKLQAHLELTLSLSTGSSTEMRREGRTVTSGLVKA